MVQLAIQAPEKFKNDARVKESATTKDSTKVDDMLDQYKQKFGDGERCWPKTRVTWPNFWLLVGPTKTYGGHYR